MRKFLSLILIASSIIILATPVLADSIDDTTSGGGSVEDLYKDVPKVENAFAGQKQITDEDFDKTYQKLKAKKDKRLKKNQPFKGQNLKEQDSGTYLQETDEKNLLLGLPVTLINQDGGEIPIGHYSIIGEKVNNKIYIDFYQSYTCIAKVPAVATEEDFGQKSINFVQLIPYNEKYIKLIYGSVDFNAYTYIPIKGGVASQDN